MTSSTERDIRPYLRLVDTRNQGWLPTADEAGATVYRADYGFRRDLPERPLSELERDRGPLRPVLPITDEDHILLDETFRAAGRKTVTTIAAALEEVFHTVREQQGGLNNHASYDYAMRTLTAGREGSWESEALKELVLFGNGLNLVATKRGENPTVAARRQAGPGKRVDIAAKAALVEVFTRWTSSPDRYTEVAATLAAEVSGFADRAAGPGGWKAVADQWLQPGGLAAADTATCYGLLYSVSEHFNPDVLAAL